MRVAIYARVSTLDKSQDPENQLRELRAWCANSSHTIIREYVESESGRKGADKRKQFAALFEDAAKRKFDCVLFWALDRFSREGMAQTIVHLQRLTSYGVTLHNTTPNPTLRPTMSWCGISCWPCSRPWQRLRHRRLATAQRRAWPGRRLRASRLAGRGLGLRSGSK